MIDSINNKTVITRRSIFLWEEKLIILLVFYLAVMLRYNVTLSIVGIVAAIVNMLALRLASKKRVNMSRVMQRDGGKLSGVAPAFL